MIAKWALALSIIAGVATVAPLKAEEIKILASPNAQAIPLFVLAEKQHEWLPGATVKIIEAPPPEDAASLAAGIEGKGVQYGLFNVLEGAKLHQAGKSDLRLAASLLWGSPVVLAKNEIPTGDWAALRGSTGVTTALADMPLYALGKAALRRGGLSDEEIDLRSMSHAEIVNWIEDEAAPPVFMILPEPEATQTITQQEKYEWRQRYKYFAEVTTVLSPGGLPLGGLWVVDNQDHASEVLGAFRKAILYANDPQNITAVAIIVAEGYKKHFGAYPDLSSSEVVDILKRGNVILRYDEAGAIKGELRNLWRDFGLSPDEDIFYAHKRL